MMNENIEDLFICGKCRRHFTDLHFFLSHRLTCRATRVDGTSTEANLSVGDLDPMLDETSSTSDLIPTHPSNEFDLLFSSPVDQMVLNSDLLSSNVSYVKSSSGIAVECPVCDKHFEDGQILENHLFEHSTCLDDLQVNQSNRKSPLECQTCTISFTSNASLSLHKKLTHCLRPVFRCLNSQCSQLFDKPVDYILHARIHSQKHNKSRRRKATHRCRICKRVFLSFEQLQIHINKDEHEFSCQLCSAIFRSNNAYHNHLAHHQERIPVYRCYLCEESFQKRTDLSKHISIKHQDDFPKQKTCSMCKLTFKTTFHLNRHNITKHSDVKPYKCEQEGCQQAFARKDKLKQHAAKHTPTGGMFKCEICVKTFVRAEHLRDHDIVRHSHQFPFRCEYCRKGFLHPNQLYSHHKQHHPKESDESPVDSTGL